ncbi:uncharacterized protein LOC122055277 [Zingiber officinale]|uniref:uncharacterized protein LOC122055277 n=1 Tax=Zingiber officinale TaxID=94328 RepID=UPI001C4D796E|nr:uncharacterized protein LOC122055277 [Zingiber officinale]
MNEKKKQTLRACGGIKQDFCFLDVDEDEEDAQAAQPSSKESKKRSLTSTEEIGSGSVKGPMDLFITKKKTKGGKLRQTRKNDACDKELRDRTVQKIAHFMYQAAISFNAAHLDSFKEMIEAIGQYRPNLKPPSYHELRVPLLQKEIIYTNELLKENRDECEKYGCSIMSDGWTDRKQRTLINFLVNSPKGTMFLESVDASAHVKIGTLLYELLDRFVERVGEKNVVQVISDNGSNYVLAGKLLQAKRPNLFWTPCAAHCIDLMLEDIGKIEVVRKTISRAIALVGFIYNHGSVLHMMRECTENKELARHGVTRFATTFLTLQSLHKRQKVLKRMFLSAQWIESKGAKDAKGKRANDIVFMPSFWNNVTYTLKVMCPLVMVLRIADNETRPTMGYIYEAMDRAKETILKSFDNNREKYTEVTNGLFACIQKLIPSPELRDKIIIEELPVYKKSESLFGNEFAIRASNNKDQPMTPANWWKMFGNGTPNLKEFAIKVLSLTCSASGCERNWSIFEHIHSKKRNRLDHKKLQDLVYVKYNQTLKSRAVKKDKGDPIVLRNIDGCSNEWLIGMMEAGEEPIFDDDDATLTWNVVGRRSDKTY